MHSNSNTSLQVVQTSLSTGKLFPAAAVMPPFAVFNFDLLTQNSATRDRRSTTSAEKKCAGELEKSEREFYIILSARRAFGCKNFLLSDDWLSTGDDSSFGDTGFYFTLAAEQSPAKEGRG